jgi:uncharacterized repeat protein (TIGR01451 family)
MRRLCYLAVPTLAVVLGSAAPASADTTLGTTTQPAGSSQNSCQAQVAFAQNGSSSAPFAVPAGGGIVKQWSTNVTGATSGADIYLVVLRPSGGMWVVDGVDHEQVPSTPPAGGIATFNVATPFYAQGGDIIGLYSQSTTEPCYWEGGSIPPGNTAEIVAQSGPAPLTGPPTTGQTLQAVAAQPDVVVDVSAVVAPASADSSVSTGFVPTRPTVNAVGVLESTVTNRGPDPANLTFTDTVPPGVSVAAAVAGNGNCTVSGQLVTCNFPALASGRSSRVSIIVTFAHKGRYMNNVSVTNLAGERDPNTRNNSATTTLHVTRGGPTGCVVPKLKDTRVGVAKSVLKLLGCKVKVKKQQGTGVSRHAVLKTKPGPGSYKLGRKITLVVRK